MINILYSYYTGVYYIHDPEQWMYKSAECTSDQFQRR